MFRPPTNRTMMVLDRLFFCKEFSLTAARVLNNQNIHKYQRELERNKDLLVLDRVKIVRPDPQLASEGRRCLLLKPEIRVDDASTWGSKLWEMVRAEEVKIIPYHLKLDYDYWTYHDIMSSILPEEAHDDLPSSYSTVGHVAHLNLREQFLPYKYLIATVLMDKNPAVTTVINKVDDVGTSSEYRTFNYEVLAGKDDLNVEVIEEKCVFRFDYAKVYWNTRLHTEHRRIRDMFQPGEAVCDAMAGVGPFAIPAGKNGVFVWASDLNPDSYVSLEDAIRRNNVQAYVKPFNMDAKAFIPWAAGELLKRSKQSPTITIPRRRKIRNPAFDPGKAASAGTPSTANRHITIDDPLTVRQPTTFAHYVMNLPASATSFLPAFRGLYAGHEDLFEPHTATRLPMVHVYCFSTKSEDNKAEEGKICAEINLQLFGEGEGEGDRVAREGEDPMTSITPAQLSIHDVRDVAPQKRMFCASFRLPAAVAFGTRTGTEKGSGT